ncbi:MAG: hypothetical protein K2X93_29305, partial [Candidatus Obscuribacterales bacterium]|nr:hypothetical protein [Candidatus Obscuribacterales bacterium]
GETPAAVKPTEPVVKPGETPSAVKPTEPVVKPGETPTTVKPGEGSTSVKPAATDDALKTTVNQQQARRIESSVAQVQDDIAKARQAVAPNSPAAKALDDVSTGIGGIQAKVGGNASLEKDLASLRTAANDLEKAGESRLANRINQAANEIENAKAVRGLDLGRAPAKTVTDLTETAIQNIRRDVHTLQGWGSPLAKSETLRNLQENLQLLRYLAQTAPRLLAHVEKLHLMVSRFEMAALAKAGNAVEANVPGLLKLAKSGDPQALDKLLVSGLKSDGWKLRGLSEQPKTWVGRQLNSLANGGRVVLGLMQRPEFYKLSASMAAHASLTSGGLTVLYANYKYHSQLLLAAIQRQLDEQSTESIDVNPLSLPLETELNSDQEEKRSYPDLDFTPSVAEITRHAYLNPATMSLAKRYCLPGTEDDKWLNWIESTGRIYGWGHGVAAPSTTETMTPVIQTARTIRVKGPDGSTDSTTRPKTAVTTFSFTRAMELTNQVKLLTSGGDNNRGAAGKVIAGLGAGPGSGSGASVAPTSLSNNLRTMVAFSSFRPDGATHATQLSKIEGTEQTGIDQGGGTQASAQGAQVVQGTFNTDPSNTVASNTMGNTTGSSSSSSASSSDPGTVLFEDVEREAG